MQIKPSPTHREVALFKDVSKVIQNHLNNLRYL
jgi:hypothetical protein